MPGKRNAVDDGFHFPVANPGTIEWIGIGIVRRFSEIGIDFAVAPQAVAARTNPRVNDPPPAGANPPPGATA